MHPTKVRLAHELGNLTNVDVVASYDSNLEGNPNSIQYIVERLGELESNNRTLKIVSPYLFLPKYKRKDGSVYRDGRVELQAWLDEHPDNRVEIVTNSILTSDNFFTQAIIDMDTAPRMLLSEDLKKQWGDKLKDSELNPDLVASEAWLATINNPRVKIYQTGRMDSDILGGDVAYGKLHAKFFMTDKWGFIGTTNLDYRSLLYNNEMGFFFASDGLMRELLEEFESLKSQSYLWGSPEWLEMRSAVRDLGDSRSRWAKKQRTTFTRLRTTGLHWLF
jgi:phosphatidylserine/phosphatidylglycerophosphate/cardiolipin synthase-like enzyme